MKPSGRYIKNLLLRRYWVEFALPEEPLQWPPRACGVTAYTVEDALHVLRVALFPREPLPPVHTVIEDVDLRALDAKHILPNITPPVWCGVWYPPIGM